MRRWSSLVHFVLITLALAACGGSDTPVTPQSVTLQLSSSAGTVIRGSTGTSTLTLTRVGGYTGTVALSADGLPTGVTAAFTPTQLSGTESSASVVFTVGAATTPGVSTITVRAAGSGVTAATATYTLTVPAPAITLAAGTTTASIVQGATATVPITITRTNGFTDAVTLTATGMPTGVTATFAPTSIAAGTTTSTLSLVAAANAAVGAASITITAAGSGVSAQTATVALTVTAAAIPAFSMTATPAALSVVAGQSGTTSIAISRSGGFSGDVTLALEGAPTGVTGAFAPTPIAAAATSSTLTLTTTAQTAPGAYNLTVRGTGTGVTAQTTILAVTVTPAPAITIAAAPSTVTVAAGSAVTTVVTITRLGGFAADVALAATGLPAGVTAAFSPAPLTGATLASTLTLTSVNTAAVGNATITVTASGTGVTSQTATVALSITAAPSYTMTATAVTVQQGASATSTITLVRSGGFVGAVNLAITGLPNGVTAAFNPAAVTGTSSTVTLSAAGNATTGALTATVTGTAAGLANVTTNVSGNVTVATGGGSVAWQFCNTADLPIWFAFRNGTTGAWTRVTPNANNTFSFDITSVGGVAWAETGAGIAGEVYVQFGTAAELTRLGAAQCTTNPARKSLSGTFAGLAIGQTGQISVGNAYTQTSVGLSTFNLTGVADGTTDLLAFRTSSSFVGNTFQIIPDRAIVRRGVNYAAGSAIPLLDFGGSESFAPAIATVTLANGGSGTVAVTTSLLTANGSFSGFTFGALSGGTSPYTVYGLPGSLTLNGDFHVVQASSTTIIGNTPVETRTVSQFNRDLASRSLTLGPSLNIPAFVTVTTVPYARLRASGTWQTEYGDQLYAIFAQSATGASRTWTVQASRGYLGSGSTFDVEVPDLSTVAGFDVNWGLRGGVQTQYTAIAYSAGTATSTTEGLVVRTAIVYGAGVP